LTNHPTLVHVDVPCCAVRSCPVVNDNDSLAGFSDVYPPLPFDAFNEGDLLELSGLFWCGKTRMAGLQSGKGLMMIDSVVWAQYINVTDRQTDRQTDRYVTIADAVPTHCVGRQMSVYLDN